MVVKIKLKTCPKCGGRIIFDRDEYGSYEQCIQCGYVHDLDVATVLDTVSNDDFS